MYFENVALVNFVLLVGLVFWMYRTNLLQRHEYDRRFEELHQELHNNVKVLEDQRTRDTEIVYREIDTLWERVSNPTPKKKTSGINSRIPL